MAFDTNADEPVVLVVFYPPTHTPAPWVKAVLDLEQLLLYEKAAADLEGRGLVPLLYPDLAGVLFSAVIGLPDEAEHDVLPAAGGLDGQLLCVPT